MKTRFPSILGAFVAILMVASFMIPYGLASPPSGDSASASIVKWDTIAPSTLIESSASPPVSSISIRIAELATAAYWPKILNIDTISSSMSILASPSPPAQALVTLDGLAQSGTSTYKDVSNLVIGAYGIQPIFATADIVLINVTVITGYIPGVLRNTAITQAGNFSQFDRMNNPVIISQLASNPIFKTSEPAALTPV